MVFFSVIGNRGILWLALAAIGLLFTDRKADAWRLVLTMLCTYLVVEVTLKTVFARPRPHEVLSSVELLIPRPTSSSFPSTHAAMGIAGAMAGARLFPGATWALWPIGILVALSRVYVGAHWPSDVLAGGLMGAACAWFVLGGRSIGDRRRQYGMTDSQSRYRRRAAKHSTTVARRPPHRGLMPRHQSRKREEPVMSEVITYVGIDAHKRDLHVAMLVGTVATPVTWTVANEPKAIERLARKLEREAPGPVQVCYEAGPCGYALQRQLDEGARAGAW